MPGISRPINIWQRILVYTVLLFVLSSVQVYPKLWIHMPAPDFLLLFPLVVGLTRGGQEGFIIGLIAGFLRDYLSGRLYGLGMLEGMIIALLASFFFSDRSKIFWKRLFFMYLGVTLAHEVATVLLSYFFPLYSSLPLNFLMLLRDSASRLPLVLLANLLATAIICFFLWLGFYQRKKKRKKSALDSHRGYDRAF